MSDDTGVKRPQAAKELTRTQYVGKEFDTYRGEIEKFIRQRFGDEVFNNFKASDQGVMFWESVSYALDNGSWTMDRQADETYIDTAEFRDSMARLTRQIAYKMRGAVPSSATIEMSLDESPDTLVIVEAGTRISGPGDITYRTTESVEFEPSYDPNIDEPKEAFAQEVELDSTSFVSNGDPNQEFEIQAVPGGRFLVDGSVKVTVDGVEWEEVKFMKFVQEDIYEVNYNTDPPVLVFGDGVAGNIPTQNSTIQLEFKTTIGPEGNVQSDTLTSLSDPVVADGESVEVNVTNPEPGSGGEDPETVDEARINAPNIFHTLDRAVTKRDYRSIINAFRSEEHGAVAEGTALVVREFEEDAVLRELFFMLKRNAREDVKLKDVEVTGSSGNDGTYRALQEDSEYKESPDNTEVHTVEDIPDSTADGQIEVEGNSFDIVDVNQSERFFTVDGRATEEISRGAIPATEDVIEAIKEYWDKVVSGGCKANSVQALIVSEDDEGVYTAPSVGLAEDLEAHLNERKESTVDVSVHDASNNILFITADIQVKVREGFKDVDTLIRVREAGEDYLTNRKFGEFLRISDLYNIVETTEGVEWSHVEFSRVESINSVTGERENVTNDTVIVGNEQFDRVTPDGDVAVRAVEIPTLDDVVVSKIGG